MRDVVDAGERMNGLHVESTREDNWVHARQLCDRGIAAEWVAQEMKTADCTTEDMRHIHVCHQLIDLLEDAFRNDEAFELTTFKMHSAQIR